MSEIDALHINSPMLESPTLASLCGCDVLLKMDSSQPSGSFKIRGLGNLIIKSVRAGVKLIVTASGGNAGMATAYAGRKLNIPVRVVIPHTTNKIMIKKLEDEGAIVEVHGEVWDEANEKALELAKQPNSLYVHPFDHELVWEGCEGLVEEILSQCPATPRAIVVCVGGGGLLCGVLQGIIKKGVKVPVVAMETTGANSFQEAIKAGKPVNIGKIDSIAKTLGALSVTPRVFDLLPHSNVKAHMVSDAQAAQACINFANEHRVMVEPSCGASLAAGYTGLIKDMISKGEINPTGPVVFVVCGGNAADINIFDQYKKMFNLK